MKVVIADDEKIALNMLKKYIAWDNLHLTLEGTAADGEELLALIRKVQPDLVITDIRMPVYNGLEIIAKALEEGFKPYFLITSAYTDFTYARQAMRLNVEDFLPKPIDRRELTEALQKIINQYNRSHEAPTVSALISNARTYIEEHYNEKITLEDISEHFFISPNYFSSLFKKEMQINYGEYLTNVRMRHAEILLEDPQYSIAEVAEMTGYKDVSHFSTAFAKKHGIRPSAFRKNGKNELLT